MLGYVLSHPPVWEEHITKRKEPSLMANRCVHIIILLAVFAGKAVRTHPKTQFSKKRAAKMSFCLFCSYSIFNSLSWQKDKYQTDPKLILYSTVNRNINIAPETLNNPSWRKKVIL